jgi:hypothetical protein
VERVMSKKGYLHVKTTWHGPRVTAKTQQYAVTGLHKAIELIYKESQKIVPYDKGQLQGSCNTLVEGKKLQAYIGYHTPYAKRLHEHPEYHFRNKRKGKWLESTLNEYGAAAAQLVADEIAKGLK